MEAPTTREGLTLGAAAVVEPCPVPDVGSNGDGLLPVFGLGESSDRQTMRLFASLTSDEVSA
jgi:hypothetical protein